MEIVRKTWKQMAVMARPKLTICKASVTGLKISDSSLKTWKDLGSANGVSALANSVKAFVSVIVSADIFVDL